MYSIRNYSLPNSGEDISSNSDDSPKDFGWETKTTHLTKRYEEASEQIIKLANSKVSLKQILDIYHVSFQERFSVSGWTQFTNCPFPDHRDSDPSFHYNAEDDRFHCFGCSRAGRAVQFLSGKKRISISDAAQELISKFSDIENVFEEIADNHNEEIDKLLFDFSLEVKNFIKQHKDVSYAEEITWALDLYLEKHVPKQSIDVKNLAARIEVLQDRLSNYE